MKHFVVTWAKKEKYFKPIERKTYVTTAGDAKDALQICCKENGNLKKIDIVSIQEMDKNWKKDIGEPITPMDGTTVVPVMGKSAAAGK